MEKKDEELIRSLMSGNYELRKAYEAHLEFERQLHALQRKAHLSAEEEVERRRIQKLKLAGKDTMMAILDRHREG